MSAAVPDAGGAALDPTRAGVTLRDPSGSVLGVSSVSVRLAKRGLAMSLGGKGVALSGLATHLQVTGALADATGTRCAASEAVTLRRTGKKGTLRFP